MSYLPRLWHATLFATLFLTATLHSRCSPAETNDFGVLVRRDRFELREGEVCIAAYIFRDPKISRPYFAHLHAPGNVQVSRNHPPIAGKDKADHPTYHPGLWLAFGDINGQDYWRLKATVTHARMVESPQLTSDRITFAVENHYLTEGTDAVVCKETCHYRLRKTPFGYLLAWESVFRGDTAFAFGDQEEMGLGIRVATPLRVEPGRDPQLPEATGTILDSEGRRNGAEVWGEAANWVDYHGLIDGKPAGIAIFCHPDNFRPSRFHARDYGFIAANPFSVQAFKLGDPIKTVVEPGQRLRLRYGILLHAGSQLTPEDLESSYRSYLQDS